MFHEEVSRLIGHYVYRLIDPRNGETFYVGRGIGNRVFQHVAEALNPNENEDAISLKFARIRAIRNAQLEVVHVIHRHDIPRGAVAEVEAALIDAYVGLANIQGGEGSSDRGPVHATEIVARYGLGETTRRDNDRLLLININRSGDEESMISCYQ